MKIVSYLYRDKTGFGVLNNNESHAVDASQRFGSLKAVLEQQQLAELKDWVQGKDATVDLSQVAFLAPVPDAERIICIGRNFEKIHPIEGKIPPPDNISLFSKVAGSLVGHQQSLQRPNLSDSYDYEGEITLVIGKQARAINKNQAAEVIAGITILNDGSVREYQKHSVTAGKNFDCASSIGPWMATMDEVGDLDSLHLKTWLNGNKVQDVYAHEMIFDIPTILAYVSSFITLEAGDIVSTGSPERLAVAGRISPYLQVGDTVVIEIDGVGRLSNTVVARDW